MVKVKNRLFSLFIIVFLSVFNCFGENMSLNILCWEGYSKYYTDEFEILIKEKYDIDIEFFITFASDPSEFWNVVRLDKADLISPAHNLFKSDKNNFISTRMVLPIDLKNIPNYKNVIDFLQYNDFVTEGGEVYGIPYAMGQYALAYNADKVLEPSSWSVLWEPENKQTYSISADYVYCNIYISELVLGVPYSAIYDYDKSNKIVSSLILKEKVMELSRNSYSQWKGTASPDEFPNLKYATTWGYAVAVANAAGGNWKIAKPKEGSTVWVDHWAISRTLKNYPKKKIIAEEWLNYILSPSVQIGVVRNWGVSPVVSNISDKLTASEVKIFKVGDNYFWKSLSLWKNQSKRTINVFSKMDETKHE